MPNKQRRVILESWHAKAQNDGLTEETSKLPAQYYPLIRKADTGWCKLQKQGRCGLQITHNMPRPLNPEDTNQLTTDTSHHTLYMITSM